MLCIAEAIRSKITKRVVPPRQKKASLETNPSRQICEKWLARKAFFCVSFHVKYQLIRLPVRHIMTRSSYSGRVVCHPFFLTTDVHAARKYITRFAPQTHLNVRVEFYQLYRLRFHNFYRQMKDTLSITFSNLFSDSKAFNFAEIPTQKRTPLPTFTTFSNQQHLKFENS